VVVVVRVRVVGVSIGDGGVERGHQMYGECGYVYSFCF
jgi:hypothetical protein